MTCPINEKTDHPYPPSRQLLATWVVEAWEKVPEDLVRKAWVVSGYPSGSDIEEGVRSDAIVEYTRRELGTMVENIAGDDAMMAWIDSANDPEPEFPEEDA